MPARSRKQAPKMRQRSFRLPADTLGRLEDTAARHDQTANALAQRLIEEGLRIDSHPLIHFRSGTAGRRPALVGTRLDVWQVIETLRAEGGDVTATAEYFDVPEAKIRACVSYYAEFGDEIDAWVESQRRAEEREHERLQREQQLLA
jgi:uncharacterized protein (DUF433 family)